MIFRTLTWRPLLALTLIAALALPGCAGSKRPELTESELQQRSQADLMDMAGDLRGAVAKVMNRVHSRGETSGARPTMNILAMSGGGDFGAFGAGFLVGWGQNDDPNWRRPDFDAVTGVSTGALLAPFAYLGTDESCKEVEDFYRNPKKDWLRSRGPLFFLPSNPSFMKIPGLERDVRETINEDFVEQLAAESKKGKILAISATDLDFGRQRYWELGAESEAAVQANDHDRIATMMLASAAIPAIFPPVMIDGSAYGDGGVTANVLLKLDPKNPNAFIPRWRAEHPGEPLPKVRYWVIINNQLRHVPKTVQPRWPAVVGPSLETSIRSATIAEVRWLAAEADYINAVYDADIEVWVVAIPDDWRAPVSGDFERETMVSLSDLGRKLGADESSWTLWTTPLTK